MKRILIILAIVVNCTLLIDNCMSQWVQQSVPVTSGIFFDMKFVNANTGFITHYNPDLLLKTEDAGYNWVVNKYGRMSSFSIVDSLCFYGAGYNNGYGKIYKTTNGGISWDSLLTANGQSYLKTYFFNRDTGLISSGNGTNNQIWMTTDGGQTKQLIQSFGGAGQGTFFFLKEKINGEYYGWMYYPGGFQLRYTTNSGLVWFTHPDFSENVNSIFFINNDTGWAVSYYARNYLYYTTNGGVNWTTRNLPYSQKHDIYFVNSYIGWVSCDLSNKIFATTNGGVIWGTQTLYGGASFDLYFLDSLTGWAQTSWNTISHTTNGGGTITSIISGSTEAQKDYRLYQNYPNPFNSTSNLKFEIVNSGHVKIIVYDVQGREVQTLVNESLKPGTYETTFDASALATGIYFYKIFATSESTNQTFTATRKLMVLK